MKTVGVGPVEAVSPPGFEKRRHPRTIRHVGQEFTVWRLGSHAVKGAIRATLWDASYGGIGMELPEQLDNGEEIDISGKFVSDDYSLKIEGRAKIVHCRRVGRGLYRAGVAFVDVHYEPMGPGK